MDNGVKASIDARYIAFENSYELTDEVRKEIDELFDRIKDFGKTCSDCMDFETKFASSPLNKEYTDMFTKVSQKCKVKQLEHYESDEPEESKAGRVAKKIAGDAKYLADDLTMPARRKAREEIDSKLRDTPYGKIEQIENMSWLGRRFVNKFKRKNSDKEDIQSEESDN